jgi:hypothetical protein
MFSYKEPTVGDYQSIQLLAPLDENNNPKNLFFGTANRQIYQKDNQYIYSLEIYCDLLVLDGNIYDPMPRHTVNQHYKVYLIDSTTNNKIFLDELLKDGDGVYKLKYKSDKLTDLVKYNIIHIVYSLDNNEQLLLQGLIR